MSSVGLQVYFVYNLEIYICCIEVYIMDSATEDLYFQKIQELVQDEDKIVTVASLASDLGISIQNSQKLISKYVEDQRKLKSNDLVVTYVLTGTFKGNCKKGVYMVKEVDLGEKEQLFESEPCKLVYSLQKDKHVDFNIIALVDMFDSTKIRDKALDGSIVSKNCVKRLLKVKKPPAPPPPTLKGKSSSFEPKPGVSTEISKSAEKHPDSSKNGQKTKASGNIANLFKAAAAKSSQQNSEKDSVSNSKPKKQTGKNGGLTSFLSNGGLKSSKGFKNGDIKKEMNKEMKEISEINKEKRQEKNDRQDKITDDIVEIFDEDFEEDIKQNKKEETIKKSKENTKKPNKRRRDKSQEMPSKKRRRIVERNDSDSDDLFEKDDNEDIVEKSDDESERIPSPVRQKPLPPKNKRRKVVERNYTDEEGFVVTKTEYIYETASEDENEAPNPPKPVKQQEKQEQTKPKGSDKKKPAKNQATLMNFFKKV